MAILAFATIISLAGCPNPVDPGGEKKQQEQQETLVTKNLTIAGTFPSQQGGDVAKFTATAGEGARSLSARTISATSFELEGLLEDGDIIFRLRGSYNSNTKTYSLSAASSILRYTISGGFNDATGVATTGEAVIQVRDINNNEWTTIVVTITPATAADAPQIVAENEDAIEDYIEQGGIPLALRGIWRDTVDASFYAMVSAFSIVVYELVGGNWVEASDGADGSMAYFFTDVVTENGVTTGVNAFMDWDWEKMDEDKPNYWEEMNKAFFNTKWPGKTVLLDVHFLRNLYLDAQMALPDAQNQVKHLIRADGPYGSWEPTSWVWDNDKQEMVGIDLEWRGVEVSKNTDWTFSFGAWHDSYTDDFDHYWNVWWPAHMLTCHDQSTLAHRNHLQAWLDANPYLRDKYQMGIHKNDHWDIMTWGDYYEAFMQALDALATQWGAINNYIVIDHMEMRDVYEEMSSSGFQNQWIMKTFAPNGLENSPYWCRFYTKLGLKLHGRNLITGSFFIPGSALCSAHMTQEPDGSIHISPSHGPCNACDNFKWPVYYVRNYNNIHLLTAFEWYYDFPLSR